MQELSEREITAAYAAEFCGQTPLAGEEERLAREVLAGLRVQQYSNAIIIREARMGEPCPALIQWWLPSFEAMLLACVGRGWDVKVTRGGAGGLADIHVGETLLAGYKVCALHLALAMVKESNRTRRISE